MVDCGAEGEKPSRRGAVQAVLIGRDVQPGGTGVVERCAAITDQGGSNRLNVLPLTPWLAARPVVRRRPPVVVGLDGEDGDCANLVLVNVTRPLARWDVVPAALSNHVAHDLRWLGSQYRTHVRWRPGEWERDGSGVGA